MKCHDVPWCFNHIKISIDLSNHDFPRFSSARHFKPSLKAWPALGRSLEMPWRQQTPLDALLWGTPKKKNITKMCQTFLTNKWRWWVYHLTCLTGCFKKKIYRGDLPHHRFHLLDSLALSRWNLSFGKWWEALGVRNWKISKIEGNFQPESAVPAYTTQIGVAE